MEDSKQKFFDERQDWLKKQEEADCGKRNFKIWKSKERNTNANDLSSTATWLMGILKKWKKKWKKLKEILVFKIVISSRVKDGSAGIRTTRVFNFENFVEIQGGILNWGAQY